MKSCKIALAQINPILGNLAYNKNKILEVFSGSKNALLEIIALNSAAALVVCEKENDFGKKLNSGAHLTKLRRTKIGDHSIEKAFKIDDFIQLLK